MVVSHEQDHRGLVGAGGGTDGAGPRDQDKSCDGVGVVSNPGRQRCELVQLAGNLGTDRRIEP